MFRTGSKKSRIHQALLFVSWSRRTWTASIGKKVAKRKMPAMTPPSGPESNVSRKATMAPASMLNAKAHQNSLRQARPRNLQYFPKHPKYRRMGEGRFFAPMPATGSSLNAFPHEGQSAALERTEHVLQRIARLAAWPPSGFLWQQYCQTEEFRRAGCQPYFILRAYEASRALPLLLREMDRLHGGTPFRPADIPPAVPVRAPSPQEPLKEYSRFLPEEDRDSFYAAARADLLSLLERTARHFRFSGSSSPWEYVFGRPQFAMLRHDAAFVHGLTEFILRSELPPSFFSCLDAAYGAAPLPDGDDPCADLPDGDAGDALRTLRNIAGKRRHGEAPQGFWERLAQSLRGNDY